MKAKKLTAMFAALALILTMTACGNKNQEESSAETSNTEASTELTSETSSVATSTTELTSSDDTEDNSSDPEDSDTDDTSGDDHPEPVSFSPLDVNTTEYVGKWECVYMLSAGDPIYEASGVPLYGLIHLEIDLDGKMRVISNDGTPAGEIGDNQENLYWDYFTENSIYVTDDPESDGTEPLAMCFLVDSGKGDDSRYLVFAADDGQAATDGFYFRQVDEYTPVDVGAKLNQAAESETETESITEDSAEN